MYCAVERCLTEWACAPSTAAAQEDVRPPNGYAIQCRITSEDPELNFQPDSGRIQVSREAGLATWQYQASRQHPHSARRKHADALPAGPAMPSRAALSSSVFSRWSQLWLCHLCCRRTARPAALASGWTAP